MKLEHWKTYIMAVKKYIQRSLSYISIANSLMIGILFLESRGIDINVQRFGLFILFATLCGLVFAGFVEDKFFGLFEEEARFSAVRNPVLMEIKRDIKEIKEKLK